ncbi:MAG: cell wall-binding repeat-containing protein, partial [Lachnospiraceae bacterium]|nr:cell wall-binding repeat-containing protein [Candidatus Equihabitans merdae]
YNYEDINSLLICNGWNYADALSASSCPYPILMVEGNLTPEQKVWLENQDIDTIYPIGGTAAVRDGTVRQIVDITGAEVKRLAGATRTETSVKVAEEFFQGDVDTAVITYSWNFPDGLVGGPIAYIKNAPLLLASNDDKTVKSYFTDHNVEHIIVMGGTANITDATARDILGK